MWVISIERIAALPTRQVCSTSIWLNLWMAPLMERLIGWARIQDKAYKDPLEKPRLYFER